MIDRNAGLFPHRDGADLPRGVRIDSGIWDGKGSPDQS